jgi:hypothetical protein
MDHNSGNAKKATRPNPDTMTRPNSDPPLTRVKKERKGFLSFIEDSLELSNKTGDHLALSEALQDTSQRGLVLVKAENLANKGNNPEAYLKAIARDNPRHLLPDPPKLEPKPDYSYLPLAIQEALAREAAL